MSFCTRCGNELATDDLFCANCGTSVSGATSDEVAGTGPEAPAANDASASRPRWTWWAGAGVLGLVVAVAVTLLVGGDDEDSEPAVSGDAISYAGLSLVPPEGWNVVAEGEQLVLREGAAELGDALVFGGRIRVDFVAVETDPVDAVNAGLLATATQDTVATLSSVLDGPDEIDVAGQPAVSITLRLDAREGTLDHAVSRIVIAPVVGGTYSLSFEAHPGDAEDLVSVYDDVLAGVTLTG